MILIYMTGIDEALNLTLGQGHKVKGKKRARRGVYVYLAKVPC